MTGGLERCDGTHAILRSVWMIMGHVLRHPIRVDLSLFLPSLFYTRLYIKRGLNKNLTILYASGFWRHRTGRVINHPRSSCVCRLSVQLRLQHSDGVPRIHLIMRPSLGAASIAPRPSVRPSRASDFLETGKP